MKFLDIAKKIGLGLLGSTPIGAVALGAVNAFLPGDKQLPMSATGEDAILAAGRLPAEDQARLMEKQFDVDETKIKESHSTLRTMLESDAANPQSTRPKIAHAAFWVVAAISLLIIGMWAYAIGIKDQLLVKTIVEGWPFVLAIIGPFVGWLNNYFGTLKVEHRDRLVAAGGNSPTGLLGLLSSFMKK